LTVASGLLRRPLLRLDLAAQGLGLVLQHGEPVFELFALLRSVLSDPLKLFLGLAHFLFELLFLGGKLVNLLEGSECFVLPLLDVGAVAGHAGADTVDVGELVELDFELGDFLFGLLNLHLQGVGLRCGVQALFVDEFAAVFLVLQGTFGVAHVDVEGIGVAAQLSDAQGDVLELQQ